MKIRFFLYLWALVLFVAPAANHAQDPDGDPCHEFLDDLKAAKQRLRDLKSQAGKECKDKQCAELEEFHQAVHAFMGPCAAMSFAIKAIAGNLFPERALAVDLTKGLNTLYMTPQGLPLYPKRVDVMSAIKGIVDIYYSALADAEWKAIADQFEKDLDHIDWMSAELKKEKSDADAFFSSFQNDWNSAENDFRDVVKQLESCDEDFSTKDVPPPTSFDCPSPLYNPWGGGNRCDKYAFSYQWN